MSSRTRSRRLAKKNGAATETPVATEPVFYKTIAAAKATGAERSQIVGKKGKYTIEI